MNISPVNCPDSGCYWAAFGIPDKYTEARAWHLAAHRAEEHAEPLTAEQVAYATRAGHKLPSCATTAAEGALPVGDQPQPLDDTRLAEIQSLDLLAMMPDRSAAIVSGHLAALLAEVERLKACVAARELAEGLACAAEADAKARIAELEAEQEKLIRWHREDGTALDRMRRHITELRENLRAVNAGWSVARDRIAELEARIAEQDRPGFRHLARTYPNPTAEEA